MKDLKLQSQILTKQLHLLKWHWPILKLDIDTSYSDSVKSQWQWHTKELTMTYYLKWQFSKVTVTDRKVSVTDLKNTVTDIKVAVTDLKHTPQIVKCQWQILKYKWQILNTQSQILKCQWQIFKWQWHILKTSRVIIYYISVLLHQC